MDERQQQPDGIENARRFLFWYGMGYDVFNPSKQDGIVQTIKQLKEQAEALRAENAALREEMRDRELRDALGAGGVGRGGELGERD